MKPRIPFSWFDRAVEPVLAHAAAVLLFLMMLLTCADVAGRYLFNRPIQGGFELTEILLAALIFVGLPLVSLRNAHVTADLLDPFLPGWMLRVQHVVACSIGIACTAYLTSRLWVRAGNMLAAGDTTGQLKIPLAWLTYFMAVLMALTAAALAVLAARDPKRSEAGEHGP